MICLLAVLVAKTQRLSFAQERGQCSCFRYLFLSGKRRTDISHANIFVLFWRTKSIRRGVEEEDERRSRFRYSINYQRTRAQHAV